MLPTCFFASVKKSWPYDAPIRLHVRKSKKVEIFKKWSWNEAGIFWQNLTFWAATFFQRLLENFLWGLHTCSRYLKGAPNLVLCVRKKSKSYHKNMGLKSKSQRGGGETPGFPPLVPMPRFKVRSFMTLRNILRGWSSQKFLSTKQLFVLNEFIYFNFCNCK